VHNKSQRFVLELFCIFDAVYGKISSYDLVTELFQKDGMPAPTARQVQDPGTFAEFQMIRQQCDKGFCFLFISVFIQLMVIACIEPFFKPCTLINHIFLTHINPANKRNNNVNHVALQYG